MFAEELFAKTEQDAKDRRLAMFAYKRFRRRKIIRYLTTKN